MIVAASDDMILVCMCHYNPTCRQPQKNCQPPPFMIIQKDIWPSPYAIICNMASIKVNLNSPVPYVKPDATYRGSHPPRQRLQVQLRIASEPGQSRLIKALSNEFINYMAEEKNLEPFSVAWISSNSAASFDHLASRSADVAITHHVAAENIAIKQGVADKSVSAWRDHWLLVGMFIIVRCLLVVVKNPSTRFHSDSILTQCRTKIKPSRSHLQRGNVGAGSVCSNIPCRH